MTDIPRTSKILAILLPITFPIAISGKPSSIAFIETVISGIDVPNPTTTELTNILEILRFFAIEIEPLIRDSPPKNKINNPDIIMNVLTIITEPHYF